MHVAPVVDCIMHKILTVTRITINVNDPANGDVYVNILCCTVNVYDIPSNRYCGISQDQCCHSNLNFNDLCCK